jgi:predicted Zn-dependent protease
MTGILTCTFTRITLAQSSDSTSHGQAAAEQPTSISTKTTATEPSGSISTGTAAVDPSNSITHGTTATEPSASNISPEIRDDHPRVKELFSQAVHLLKINHAYQARDLLEQAVALAPKSAGIHCNLGLAYQNSGNIPRALDEFKTALTLNPHMPEATLNLAGCYQSMGANAEAIQWYTTYLSSKQVAESQRKQISDIIAALQNAGQKAYSDPRGEDYLANITADGTYRWDKEKMPIRVYIQNAEIQNGKAVGGYKKSFRVALLAAFDDWCQASGNRIKYLLVPDKEHADIFCTWTSDPLEVTENGTLSERGAAKIIVKGSQIERATLKILTRPILEEGVLSEDEMKKACLHEVGHVLGLQGHSTNNHDVMFFTVDTATVWPVLSRRDRITMLRLYQSYPVVATRPISVPGSVPKSAPISATGSLAKSAPGSLPKTAPDLLPKSARASSPNPSARSTPGSLQRSVVKSNQP